MVKFVELLEYIGMIDGEATCSCCGHKAKRPNVYKKGETMVVLCTECETFIRELLE